MKRLPNTERRRRCVYHSVGVHCVDSVACVCSTLQLSFLYTGKNQSSSSRCRLHVCFFFLHVSASVRARRHVGSPQPVSVRANQSRALPTSHLHSLFVTASLLVFLSTFRRPNETSAVSSFSGSSSPRCRCEWQQSTGFLHSQPD